MRKQVDVLDEQPFDLGAQLGGEPGRQVQGGQAVLRRIEGDQDPVDLRFLRFGQSGGPCLSRSHDLLSPSRRPNALRSSARLRRRSSTSRFTVFAPNSPLLPRTPARRPVRSSIPSSIVVTGNMRNLPAPQASTTSCRSNQMLDVRARNQNALVARQARSRQMSKKPSIFSLTPPIACTPPCWLTDPVTARD